MPSMSNLSHTYLNRNNTVTMQQHQRSFMKRPTTPTPQEQQPQQPTKILQPLNDAYDNQQQQQQQQHHQRNNSISSIFLTKLSSNTAMMRKATITRLSAKTHLTSTLSLSRKKRKDNYTKSSLDNNQTGNKLTIHAYSPQPATSSSSTHNNNNIFHPAYLSNLAHEFKEQIIISTKIKDSIEYHDAFDGKDAVTKLTAIIKTTDRHLALLVGRALHQQKFFHDVRYEQTLKDSAEELYQYNSITTATDEPSSSKSSSTAAEQQLLPSGIFTPLTDCYSPSCTSENKCYSPRCPKKLTKYSMQQKQLSFFSDENKDRLWINTIPKSLLEKLSSREIKRQEIIFELIYTEEDFVNDLAYIESHWIQPILHPQSIKDDTSGISIYRKEAFVRDIFWNIPHIRKSNHLFLKDLFDLQSEHQLIPHISDIFLKHIEQLGMLEPFVEYGSHQFISQYLFEQEKATNPTFTKHVRMIERDPISRKLELNGYLTKPTTRLGRYNLFLKEVWKHTTKEENPVDYQKIPNVISLIHQFLQRVNEASGRAEKKYSLEMLQKKLSFHTPASEVRSLDLLSDEREIIMKGTLKKTSAAASDKRTGLFVCVLDHYLLMLKPKFLDRMEVYKLFKKPIPLVLLSISTAVPDQPLLSRRNSTSFLNRRSSTVSISSTHSLDTAIASTISSSLLITPPSSSLSTTTTSSSKYNSPPLTDLHPHPHPHHLQMQQPPQPPLGYPIHFTHLGKHGSTTTLYASTASCQKTWIDTIETYRHSMLDPKRVFQMSTFLTFNYNNSPTAAKVNCAIQYRSIMFLGCDDGVFMYNPSKSSRNSNSMIIPLAATNTTIMNNMSVISSERIEKPENDISSFSSPTTPTVSTDYKAKKTCDSGHTVSNEYENIVDLHLMNILPTDRKVIQIDIIEELQLMLVLLENRLIYSLPFVERDLSSLTQQYDQRMLQQLDQNVSFFKAGKINEQIYVCLVKNNTMSSIIRTLEPSSLSSLPIASSQNNTHKLSNSSNNTNTDITTMLMLEQNYQNNPATSPIPTKNSQHHHYHHHQRHHHSHSSYSMLDNAASLINKKTKSLLLHKKSSTDVGLRMHKDLYKPEETTSIQFFKNFICVASAKGMHMVNIATTEVQSVLDPLDEHHQFIRHRENTASPLLKPIALLRLDSYGDDVQRYGKSHFLLCYNEFAFYIDKKGRRVRPDWMISWEGQPVSFAFQAPYVVAFDLTFIEIRHIETGDLKQVIIGQNIRFLFQSTTENRIYFVMEDPKTGFEHIHYIQLI
ncbi:hypothetical protein BDF20DRAFT_507264 [Mycotypha africana]|uniref:uncharacterized protein n=1 Tax=Mycotypha africana TaxID=64632 RepID=UPI0023000A88|nr:uncharacterized protein BDF20DRAFT_507264 [Mycotypha africana]KAI8979454.1 hypothetical protein BDF20DRAFT_507264 [Mycotypha africana]